MRHLAAMAVLLLIGVTAAMVTPRGAAPDFGSGTGLQGSAPHFDSILDADDTRRALAMASSYLEDPMRKLAVVGRSPLGEYLVEDEAGFCLAVRVGYWPEVSERSVRPSGRFAATQALGLGC